jgi:hypothetical protein
VIAMVICFFSLISSMYTNINEQTKEIGVLRAIGVRKFFIWRLYVYEALVLLLSSSIFFFLNFSSFLWNYYWIDCWVYIDCTTNFIYSVRVDILVPMGSHFSGSWTFNSFRFSCFYCSNHDVDKVTCCCNFKKIGDLNKKFYISIFFFFSGEFALFSLVKK